VFQRAVVTLISNPVHIRVPLVHVVDILTVVSFIEDTIPIDVCGAGVSFPIVVRVSLIWVVVVGAVVTAVSHVISVIVILGWVVMEGAVVPVVWDFIIVIIVITGVADPVLVVVLLPGVGQVGAVILLAVVGGVGHAHQVLVGPPVQVRVLPADDAVARVAGLALAAVHGLAVVAQVAALGVLVAVVRPVRAGVARLAHLLVGGGVVHTPAEGLRAREARWAGQAVVAGVRVLTPVLAAVLEAGVGYFLALIHVLALDTISAVARGTGTALPAAVWVTRALDPSKAGIGQASVNWAVLLVADLVFCCVTNTVLASKLGCGVVAEPATFLHPSSTGDRTEVPQ